MVDLPSGKMKSREGTVVDADDLIYPWGLQILWECMEEHPNAGWGLCSLSQDRDRPFPFQLDSAEAYRYHYLGPGLFHKAPLSSIIRRDLFEKVGGFKPERMVGDHEMWHRLALHADVVLMNQGIVWYRSHDDQESTVMHEFKSAYNSIREHYLGHPDCPLSAEEVRTVKTNRIRQERKNRVLRTARKLLKP